MKLKLLLVGELDSTDNAFRNQLNSMINKDQDIIEYGFRNDIKNLLKSSDCLVLPSYREGFPNVILQAGAMGKPVVISDVNGSDDYIIEGVNGVIFRKGDVLSLKNALLYIIEERFNWSQEKIIEILSEKFNQVDYYNSLIKFYKSTVNSPT